MINCYGLMKILVNVRRQSKQTSYHTKKGIITIKYSTFYFYLHLFKSSKCKKNGRKPTFQLLYYSSVMNQPKLNKDESSSLILLSLKLTFKIERMSHCLLIVCRNVYIKPQSLLNFKQVFFFLS